VAKVATNVHMSLSIPDLRFAILRSAVHRSTRSTPFHPVHTVPPVHMRSGTKRFARRLPAANSSRGTLPRHAFPISVTIYDLRFTIYYLPSQSSHVASARSETRRFWFCDRTVARWLLSYYEEAIMLKRSILMFMMAAVAGVVGVSGQNGRCLPRRSGSRVTNSK